MWLPRALPRPCMSQPLLPVSTPHPFPRSPRVLVRRRPPSRARRARPRARTPTLTGDPPPSAAPPPARPQVSLLLRKSAARAVKKLRRQLRKRRGALALCLLASALAALALRGLLAADSAGALLLPGAGAGVADDEAPPAGAPWPAAPRPPLATAAAAASPLARPPPPRPPRWPRSPAVPLSPPPADVSARPPAG